MIANVLHRAISRKSTVEEVVKGTKVRPYPEPRVITNPLPRRAIDPFRNFASEYPRYLS